MTPILQWLERKILDEGIEYEADKIKDAPATHTSFLKQLPLKAWGFMHCPGFPYWANVYGDPDLTHILATLGRLKVRADEAMNTAYGGLGTDYSVGDQTHTAWEFMYGAKYPDINPAVRAGSGAPNELHLTEPHQFTMSWTTYDHVHKDSQDLVPYFTETLTDPTKATEAFWPTISTFGLPYNLLVLAKVDAKRATELKEDLGPAWGDEKMDALLADGQLYEIDMRIVTAVGASTAVDGSVRFTPGTVTVLKQDPRDKKRLTPIAIALMTTEDRPPRVYVEQDKTTWLYALQAAKASITVWGIWLGHVYHWHIVTAAMQGTMYNHLPAGHQLYSLLEPQSQSLIDFDFMLNTHLWGQIAPPTPVPDSLGLLELLDTFAEHRSFHSDDPLSELEARGLEAKDFTILTEWDAYPVVRYLLDIWRITGDFVSAVVDDMYEHDADVKADHGLEKWMAASRDPKIGNVRGLPKHVETKAELAKILASILYRITVHGAGSLNPAVNPTLSFVSNFPPCLQRADIPEPGDELTTEDLLTYLPHTGTIGGMATFYFTFAYSKPIHRLIPKDGVESDAYFSSKACNEALFVYRTDIADFVKKYTVEWNEALEKMGWGAHESVPKYAEHQAGQWPRSIEI